MDITHTLKQIKADGLHFTATMVYLISRTANAIPCFRQRIRGGEVVEHDLVHPSFTILTQVSDTFSFCAVPYQKKYPDFVADAQAAISRMQMEPSFEDEAGRDDYLYLSALPWLKFTGLNHAMHYSPVDSVPRIVWGKYYEQADRTLLPFSIQAHHALVDGRHVGEYCEHFEMLAAKPSIWNT